MKLLIVTESLYPSIGNNGNLICKLIPFLAKKHEVELLSYSSSQSAEMPQTMFEVPVHWIKKEDNWKTRFLFPAIANAFDHNGLADLYNGLIISDELHQIESHKHYDALLTMTEPYACAFAVSLSKISKKALYLMDPPANICGLQSTVFRNKSIRRILGKYKRILTTPFISQALFENGYFFPDDRLIRVGFPMISNSQRTSDNTSNNKVKLLFCGWLYSEGRSPQYFLELLSYLDNQFEVTFMGKECDKLFERYRIQTDAIVNALPHQPYEVALRTMKESDILINIGNSVPVHMPSKTLEYINTGKPMVNFYKRLDCPTLYYTKRYPLCLNLYENEENVEQAAEAFTNFCLTQKGNTVDHKWIEQEYSDCTPQYVAQKILDFLEK